MNNTVREWDVTEYLDREESIEAYLSAVKDEGDPALFQAAQEDIVKAREMGKSLQRTASDRTDIL